MGFPLLSLTRSIQETTFIKKNTPFKTVSSTYQKTILYKEPPQNSFSHRKPPTISNASKKTKDNHHKTKTLKQKTKKQSKNSLQNQKEVLLLHPHWHTVLITY
ncbi:hypothetical protein FPG3_10200 [Flavobacterium psychrophilum FPG3]|nr:hypothetical protein FPG3_10200 [Flavobacterium psychrophilum FPG3]